MTRPRLLALGMAAVAVLAVVVVVLAWPRGEPQRVLDSIQIDEASAVAVLVIESVDPNRGTITLSLEVDPAGLALPATGATLLTDVPGLGPIRLRPASEPPAKATGETLIDSAALRSYPFDHYPLSVRMVLVEGQDVSVTADVASLRSLPLDVVAISAAAGFQASVEGSVQEGVRHLDFEIDRPTPSVVWAVAMMALYWLLAISAFGVVLAVLLGLRPLETRYFAWLTAILFAFSAFRATAPGAPPIGVFFDFGAFFWAVGIVVVSQLLLLGYFLTGDRGGEGGG